MNAGELKNWLADRLRMRGPASADLDLRRDEAPYERPLQLWKTAEGNLHHEFLRAVLALVEEAADEAWEPESFDQLVRLIEAGRIGEAAGALETLAHSRRLLASDGGAQLHMQALRTLLALGWTGSLEFWQAQSAVVGSRWPGLIFRGLARNNLETAFAELPSLAVDAQAMRQVLDLFPGMMRNQKLTISDLRDLGFHVIGRLPQESANLFREWFALRDAPLPLVINVVHFSLKSALVQELGGPVIARTRYAALVGSTEQELEYA
jgi:hypothetical protein